MQIIGDLWWVWLLSMFAFGGYALSNQIRRIASLGSTDDFENSEKYFSAFSIGSLLVSALIAFASFVLLILAVLINLL